ncbi:MAG: class I SAM-dependent methyltransferase [bacterium]
MRKDYDIILPEAKHKALCLDVGAGDSDLKKEIIKRGYTYVSMDILFHSDLNVVADACHIPFKKDVFDSVISYAVFEHIPDPFRAMKEISSILKSGGNISGTVAFLEPFHGSYFHITHWGMQKLLVNNGFTNIEVFGKYHGLVFLLSSMFNWRFLLKFSFIMDLLMRVRKCCSHLVIFKRKILKQPFNKTSIDTFLSEEEFRFAATIYFKAIKR